MVYTKADVPSCLEGADHEIDEKYGLTTSAHNVLFIESLRGGSNPPSTHVIAKWWN